MKRKVINAIICSSLIIGSLCSCSTEKADETDASSVASSETTTSETAEATTVATTEETSAEPSVSYVDNSFVFTEENFPVLDGSTAMRPLGVGMASLLLGKSKEDADSYVPVFHWTDEAFYYLEDGSADVLIVAQPCQEVFDKLEEDGFEYEMEEIAMEGLVFLVNAGNPVDSLTIEEVQKIYTGEITNWSEVGGNDEEIKAFQRTETSGSQVMMHACVMGDLELMDAPTEMVPADMGGLIDAVASYDNSGNAIGYTVYYYANDMKMADGLKIISIEGVEPSVDTIGSGEYPFLNPYYCVIAHSAEEDSTARIIYNWLVSEDGQKLVGLEGYVPISAANN